MLVRRVITAFAGIGGLLATVKVLHWLTAVWRNVVRPAKDLPARYGTGTWVVITGGSSGIGYAFAQAFGQMRFNLVLISHNPEVIAVSNELSRTWQIETLPIIIDFAETQGSDQDFTSVISQKIQGLDVSILVNNVGVYYTGSFPRMPHETVTNLLRVNVAVMTKLTHALLPQLLKRGKKSAIINMSSVAGLVPAALASVYSSTKAYIRHFSLALEQEVSGTIDVLVGEPAVVRTAMSRHVNYDAYSITPELFVQRLLPALGYDAENIGAKRHKMKLESVKLGRSLESQVEYRSRLNAAISRT